VLEQQEAKDVSKSAEVEVGVGVRVVQVVVGVGQRATSTDTANCNHVMSLQQPQLTQTGHALHDTTPHHLLPDCSISPPTLTTTSITLLVLLWNSHSVPTNAR
jgi:hypothetical protein